MCGKHVSEWVESDVPFIAHRDISPNCPLMHLDRLEARLQTFEEKWPNNQNLIPGLAQSGFYYWPEEVGQDSVRCAHCGVSLDSWEPFDDPM